MGVMGKEKMADVEVTETVEEGEMEVKDTKEEELVGQSEEVVASKRKDEALEVGGKEKAEEAIEAVEESEKEVNDASEEEAVGPNGKEVVESVGEDDGVLGWKEITEEEVSEAVEESVKEVKDSREQQVDNESQENKEEN